MLNFIDIISKQNLFLPNKIRQEIKTAEGKDFNFITCVHHRGKIKWRKLQKLCQSRVVLCREESMLEGESGFKRFDETELKERLAFNLCINILEISKNLPKDFKVGIYDPKGKLADCAGELLKYVYSAVAVSEDTNLYAAAASEVLQESGAVLGVSRNICALQKCKLVIAPVKLSCVLPLGREAVILSSEKPEVFQRCRLYYNYYFSLNRQLLDVLPLWCSAQYIACALYSMEGDFKMGSIVPQAAKGDSDAITSLSLAKYIANIAADT